MRFSRGKKCLNRFNADDFCEQHCRVIGFFITLGGGKEMLTSVALIILLGLVMAKIFELLKLPRLLGMIVSGMILSLYAFNVLDPMILEISGDLRQIALIIILTRAGLSLDINDLKKVGRPAILLSFLPACFEIVAVILIAPILMGVSLLEAAIMGSMIAAVSPAIIVPRMIELINEGYGQKNSIPQLIMAGASVNDIFVIILFTVFTSLATQNTASMTSLLQIPVSILLGIGVGIVIGSLIEWFTHKFLIKDSISLLIILSISFLLLELEFILEPYVAFSALLSIMTMAMTLSRKNPRLANTLEAKYHELWSVFEIFLFVLVGAVVDLNYALKAGFVTIIVICIALIFRLAGVLISVSKTQLTLKEKYFCMIAYTPKATVQAAIGAVPLSLGLACGPDVLTLAVLSILITAPLGAIGIDRLHSRLLEKDGA